LCVGLCLLGALASLIAIPTLPFGFLTLLAGVVDGAPTTALAGVASLLLGISCLAIAAWLTIIVERTQLHFPPRCAACGYDLRLLMSNRCPECGRPAVNAGAA
jgi:hypothetical protein